MKLAIFAILFAVCMASSVFAGLKITEIDFSVDYDEAYTYRVENRDKKDSGAVNPANNSKIDADVFPGSNITLTVRVENTFPSDGSDIRGVFTTMTIEEIDDGADLDEESLDFDLEPGDDYRFDLKFSIPLDVDTGTYLVLLEAEGEDRNETLHSTELALKLEVKKQQHDIRITKAALTPSFVSCDRKSKITAEIMNLGSNLENQNAIEFKSDALGINSIDKDVSLESSDEASVDEKVYEKNLNFEAPSSMQAGTYTIFVNLYWKNFVLFDQKELHFTIRDCGAEKPEQPISGGGSAKPDNDEEQNEQEEPTRQTGFVQSIRPRILATPALVLAVLGGFIIFVIAVIAIFAIQKRNIK